MNLAHLTRPSARLFMLILFIGLFVGVMLPMQTVFAQDASPTPSVTPTETPAPTAEPVTQEQVDTVTGNADDNPIDLPAAVTIMVAVLTIMATLPGVTLLKSSLVNVGKAIGLVTDGNATRADTLLSFVLFFLLVYFQIFQRTVDLKALDTTLGQVGQIASFIGLSATSLFLGPTAHEFLKRLNFGWISKSHSETPTPSIQPYPPGSKRTR